MTTLYGRIIEVTCEGRRFKNHEIQFSATQNLGADPNEAEVRLYNLNQDDRAAIEGATLGALVEISAGYIADGPSVIYEGLVRRAYSMREQESRVTIIEASSGYTIRKVDNRLDKNYKAGTKLSTVINDLVRATGAQAGNINALQNEPDFAVALSAPLYISGPAWDTLTNIVHSRGWDLSIRGRRIDVQNRRRPSDTQVVQVLSYDSGLIGAPSVDAEGKLTCECLMVPNIFPGVLIDIRAGEVAGTYRVDTTVHSGSLYGADPLGIQIEASPL